MLTGLGFSQRDWKRRTEEFSGGWQMRIALAKLLLEKPNLLLLDEPTNHLDLEARNWLEDYLPDYPNASCWSRTTATSWTSPCARSPNSGTRASTSTPAATPATRSRRPSGAPSLKPLTRTSSDRIEQLEAFINRFRYQATKAKQVQSRIKELEKIERIEIPPDEKTIHFRFPQPKPSGRIVAEFKNVSKAYGDHVVFSGGDSHHRARRPRRAGRRQRRRQVHHDQDSGRRRAGDRRRVHPRPQRPARLFRAGPVQGARPERAHDRRSGDRRPARHQHRIAQHPRLLPLLRRRRVQADRRAFRRRTQSLCAGPHADGAVATSCCSTSPPITSTCAPRMCC